MTTGLVMLAYIFRTSGSWQCSLICDGSSTKSRHLCRKRPDSYIGQRSVQHGRIHEKGFHFIHCEQEGGVNAGWWSWLRCILTDGCRLFAHDSCSSMLRHFCRDAGSSHRRYQLRSVCIFTSNTSTSGWRGYHWVSSVWFSVVYLATARLLAPF